MCLSPQSEETKAHAVLLLVLPFIKTKIKFDICESNLLLPIF